MPRPARRILTCVLIGLLLNAGVTAVCWLAQPNLLVRATHTFTEGGSISHDQTRYLMHSEKWTIQVDSYGPPGTVIPESPLAQFAPEESIATIHEMDEYGLPFRALRFRSAVTGRYSQIVWKNPNLNHTLPFWQRGLPTGLQSHRHHRFPTEPLPGFLYNTLIYTAAVLLATGIFTRLRASRRRRQSRCAACGYPLTGLPTCPECGDTSRDEAS